jgi:hypothetical protein
VIFKKVLVKINISSLNKLESFIVTTFLTYYTPFDSHFKCEYNGVIFVEIESEMRLLFYIY